MLRCITFVSLAAVAPVLAGAPLTLDEAVDRAVAKAERENTRLATVRASLQYLEAQSRTHWEFRPQLGLFSFSNPALLATSLGFSFLPNRAQAPSSWTWQNARFDELDAEVENEQAKLQARLDAAQRFSDALAKQRVCGQIQDAITDRQGRIKEVRESVKLGRSTALSLARVEASALDLQLSLVNATGERDAAQQSLADAIDLGSTAGPLDLKDPAPATATLDVVPSLEDLTGQALRNRVDLERLKKQLDALDRIKKDSRLRIDPASIGLGHLSNSGGTKLGLDGGNYLLGGFTSTSSLGVSIRISKGGEQRALEALTEARSSALRQQLERMEDSVRLEVQILRASLLTSQEKVRLAERRVELAQQIHDSIQARERQGLETPEATAEAENELLRVSGVLQMARAEQQTKRYQLQIVCGVENLTAMRHPSANQGGHQ